MPRGRGPTGTLAMTLLVAPSITETSLLSSLVTNTRTGAACALSVVAASSSQGKNFRMRNSLRV